MSGPYQARDGELNLQPAHVTPLAAGTDRRLPTMTAHRRSMYSPASLARGTDRITSAMGRSSSRHPLIVRGRTVLSVSGRETQWLTH